MTFLDADQFPDRPDHPDFWKLSNTVLQHDGKVEDPDFDLLTYIATIVDPASLRYFIEQRVGNFVQQAAPMVTLVGAEPAVQSLWMDAFLVGVLYAKQP
jgi:hypothetical protein